MYEEIKVTVYTRVYNTPPEMLRRCIESVLQQTHNNFEYLLCDNGSTDGSADIMKEYRDKDQRIILHRCENNFEIDWMAYSGDNAIGKYITALDSDDWLEPRFLDNTIELAEKKQLDIVCTGSYFVNEQGKYIGERSIQNTLILTPGQYAVAYPYYHAFFRVGWGKLISTILWKKGCYEKPPKEIGTYGCDTLFSFLLLRGAKGIGIDNTVLHNYTVRNSSLSYNYELSRYNSDIILYNDALNFLKPYGPISDRNLKFLHCVYANAVIDTLGVIQNSSLTTAEKMKEYARIATNEVTQRTYYFDEESCKRSKIVLIKCVLQLYTKPYEEKDLQKIMQSLFPHCGVAVTSDTIPLLFADELLEYILNDHARKLAEQLLDKIHTSDTITANLAALALSRLSVKQTLLFQIKDIAFLRRYKDIYLMVWDNKTVNALDWMTGLLLDGRNVEAEETFLALYINLAAIENHEQAYILGKIRLCQYYCRKNCLQEVKELVKELESFGLGELPEVLACREICQKQGEKR